MLKNTDSDAQCHYSLFRGCSADPGYNPATCKPYLMQCYSTTAPQCSADAQCAVGKWGACANKSGGGSLYCRRSAAGCACTLATPPVRPPLAGVVWTQPVAAPYIFPEQCTRGVGTALGLAYCGGGATSYTCLIGFQRALNRLGVRADYVSSSSGGSWFYGTYSFAAARVKPADLLGVRLPPAAISLASLASTNTHASFMGARLSAPKHLALHCLEAMFLRGMPISVAYQYGLGKVLLEPYGLNDDADVMGSTPNPGLRNSAPAAGLPFWLCNSTLLHAQLSAGAGGFLKGNYPPFVMTPMYVGIPQRVHSLRLFDGGTTVFSAGGGLVEPVLFNRDPPPALAAAAPSCRGTMQRGVSDTTKTPRLHLRDYLGTSSAAQAYVFNPMFQEMATKVLKDLGLGSSASGFEGVSIFPSYKAWSPALPGTPAVDVTLGDSGFVDNLNIVSLLARGVRKVISFIHEEPPYTHSACLSGLKPLFGVYEAAACKVKVVGNATAVFPAAALDGLLAQAARTNAGGGPTFAVARGVPVLRNDFLGVAGGYAVDLMFVFVTACAKFNAQLPANIRSELGKKGKFPSFPWYGMMFANGVAGGIEGLTLPQVNLLSSYTDWTLMTLEAEVRNFLK